MKKFGVMNLPVAEFAKLVNLAFSLEDIVIMNKEVFINTFRLEWESKAKDLKRGDETQSEDSHTLLNHYIKSLNLLKTINTKFLKEKVSKIRTLFKRIDRKPYERQIAIGCLSNFVSE